MKVFTKLVMAFIFVLSFCLLSEVLSGDVRAQVSERDRALGRSILESRVQDVLNLLQQGANANAELSAGVWPTVLAIAAKEPEPAIVEMLVRHGANVNVISGRSTLLMLAARIKIPAAREWIFRTLLDAGAPVDITGPNQYTALTLAAENGCFACVEMLLTRHVNLNPRTDKGETPLMRATFNGHSAVAKRLIEAGADVRARSTELDNSVVSAASYKGLYEIVRMLDERGGDLLRPNIDGHTPLHFASGKGHLQVVQYLIQRGADVHARDGLGVTPLMAAALEGRYSGTVAYLLQVGARPNDKENNGRTSLMRAALNSNLDVMKLLRTAGGDLNMLDGEGWTALTLAIANRRYVAAEWLIHAGTDVRIANRAGLTSLHIAVEQGMEDLVELMLANGALVDSSDLQGNTPLMLASFLGHRSIARVLLTREAAPNARNKSGDTAAMKAAQKGRTDILRLLFDYKADLNLVNREGKTALGYAAEAKSLSTVDWLVRNGGK